MIIRLKAKNRVPYGGQYEIVDPLTGYRGRGKFSLLVNELKEARKANGFPIGLDFEREVEGWVCEQYPQECEEHNPAIPRRPRSLTTSDVIRGTTVMLAHWLAGRPIETREEAERRASICAGCRYNVPIQSRCGGICAELSNIVERVVGGKGTSMDGALHSCFICGCHLRAAVWTTLDVQCKAVDGHMQSQFASVPNCWKQCPK